jgi:hypothetical protein
VSVRNSLIYPEGAYGEICGYADIPNPEFPGELEVPSMTLSLSSSWTCHIHVLIHRFTSHSLQLEITGYWTLTMTILQLFTPAMTS